MSGNEHELTAEQFLNEVNAAIRIILVGGQSYTIGSRSMTRANLAELRQLKKELESQLSSDGDGFLDNTYIAIFSGR